ncbi:MAG: DNA-directed RNA polymerase subunit omega [Proteobacteria bacterium]|nr:DNA-directed RNA polymerase subunit omega [Pseudomonadota bacterium]
MARVTVEDCLEEVPNRFALIMVSRWRVRQLMKRNNPAPQMVPNTGNKVVVTSLREVAAGYVKIDNQAYSEKSFADVEYSSEQGISDDKAMPLRSIDGGSEATIEAPDDNILVAQEASNMDVLIDTDIPTRSL